MKISILLPYKENFSPSYAGAVSLHVKDTSLRSKYTKKISIYGSTNYKKIFNLNYININLTKSVLSSKTKAYLNEFFILEKKNFSDIIEIHNRPNYIDPIKKNTNSKLVLYFHNDPLQMRGSISTKERIKLLENCENIIVISKWIKKRFLKDLSKSVYFENKIKVIPHSTNKPKKINFKKKLNLITFVGKLNKAKGYDIFGKSLIKILNNFPNWNGMVIGDEARERHDFSHPRLQTIGFIQHEKVLKIFEKTSIAVACSRWEEPLGRTGFEASSRGCSVIISNRGGLPETITDGIILDDLNVKNLTLSIKKLIENKKLRLNYQKRSFKNFKLSHKKITNLIDIFRNNISIKIFAKPNLVHNKKILKIIHITNFNERHNGRLFFNTGRRINNGFIRLGHSVLEFSDRDIVSYYRSINDLNGSKRLNKKLIDVISNYTPDIIVLGHADLINKNTLEYVKKTYPNIKIAQWFLDRMDDQWKINKIRFLDKIDIVDCSFCTTWPKTINLPNNKPIFYIPNPIDDSFEKLDLFNKKHFEHDIFFAMSHGVHRGKLKRGKYDNREKFIDKLIEQTPNIKFDVYGMKNIQPIWADNYVKAISNSKMGLNLSQGKPIKYYSSDRLTQLIGNGMLTFIDRKTGYEDFFTDNELVFYDTINDLSEKIIKYSKDDKSRIRIAKKGKEKYRKYFNSTIVADYIISKTLDSKKKKYFWDN